MNELVAQAELDALKPGLTDRLFGGEKSKDMVWPKRLIRQKRLKKQDIWKKYAIV